ncbi:hypothetical protein Glove_71g22 [Diversispora epigaea]|uniref:TRP C-terminal domain-containing protein n=1 Tax=Diversispora epigaea TaxID=1348612 RepID=A0A397J9S7_9GLOM|nr:hypothetical protein Glove_71g22 [Diversispora epigaea]
MTRIFVFNLYFYPIIVLAFYISQVLSNSTTFQKRKISKDSDGTLRFIMDNCTRCGGTIVFSSFQATISTDDKATIFLEGAIPGDLSQPTAQSSFFTSLTGVVDSSIVTCYYSPHTIDVDEDSCIIYSGTAITFYYGYESREYARELRMRWENNRSVFDGFEMSFSLWSPDQSSKVVSLVHSFTSYALITGTGSNLPPISKNLTVGNPDVESSTVEKLAVGRFQPPSVYDIFRASQFFVTTSLLSLTYLPDNYRELISKFSWTISLPSFNVESLSNVADNQRRKACHMSNPPSSGFITSERIMNIPDYNLFFCVIIEFCIVLAIALVITLLLGLFARLFKFLQKKWSIVKTAANNIHFLVLGGMFRVDLSHDRDAFNAPVHTFIYGALYTQYRDHSEMKQTCLWFFVFTFAYDVIRTIATGGARQSGAVQTVSLLITKITYFILLLRDFIRKDKGSDDAQVN